MEKQRIPVYADEEMKRRIELAAAKYNVPVTQYCLTAIRPQLSDDDLLEAQQVTLAVRITLDGDFIAGLQALQERIKALRQDRPIEIDHILEGLRAERDDDNFGLG